MKAIVGISLYSKNALSSLLCLYHFFNNISDNGRTGPAWGKGEGREQGGEMTQTMYAHVNK
jgi:hypothetical protein